VHAGPVNRGGATVLKVWVQFRERRQTLVQHVCYICCIRRFE